MESEFDIKSKETWQCYSRSYYEHQHNTSVFCLTLLNMLKVSQGKSILDAGCGGGYLHPYLISKKNNETKLYALDFAENMVLISAARVKKYLEQKALGNLDNIDELSTININDEVFQKVNYNLSVGSVEHLPQFQDSTFDVYFSNLVFHLVGNQDKAFAEAFRVLKPGGRFGISIWSKRESCTCLTILADAFIEAGLIPNVVDKRFQSDKQEVIQKAEQFGFKDILCWEQVTAYPQFSYDDILDFLNPQGKEFFLKTPIEQQEKVKQLVSQKLLEMQSRSEPIVFACLMLIARKPE